MNKDTQERLAKSLTAESTDIIPYLPYLLQDFWSLAVDADEMIALLKTHADFGTNSKLLDLACGKGAASIRIAKEFGCFAKGIDLIPSFIEDAKEKAAEYSVSDRCVFVAGDVNDAVASERGYDLAIWGGAGDLLGSYPKTLAGIAKTVWSGGYILLDDAYDPNRKQQLRFNHVYLTKLQWEQLFEELSLTVVAFEEGTQELNPAEYAEDFNNIRAHAEELSMRHPEKRQIFDDYVKCQQAEYEDLQDGAVATLWLLQKK